MIEYRNFSIINREAAFVVQDLIGYARRQQPSFSSFMAVWVAFNGWMTAVTGEETDAAMIRALAADRRMNEAHGLLMERASFRRQVLRFAENWPIMNVRDVRKKLGRESFWEMSREDLLIRCIEHNVKVQPSPWIPGATPNLGQLLKAMYQVRCNLFHGEKSPNSELDRELVLSCDSILREFIDRSRCFEWTSEYAD